MVSRCATRVIIINDHPGSISSPQVLYQRWSWLCCGCLWTLVSVRLASTCFNQLKSLVARFRLLTQSVCYYTSIRNLNQLSEQTINLVGVAGDPAWLMYCILGPGWRLTTASSRPMAKRSEHHGFLWFLWVFQIATSWIIICHWRISHTVVDSNPVYQQTTNRTCLTRLSSCPRKTRPLCPSKSLPGVPGAGCNIFQLYFRPW